jgi:MFS transporter, ACS family, solute carrier family 17 (sodium-dependent inorganic phosphate cotransporter), other
MGFNNHNNCLRLGGIGVLWSLCWFIFIFETPAKHPRISQEEKRYIEESIGEFFSMSHLKYFKNNCFNNLKIGSSTSKKRPSYVPWLSIFTSPAVWAIVLVHGCSVFGYFLVVNQLPGYMKKVLHFDIKSNGLFSSLPYLGKYTMSVCASWFADHLRSTGKITTTVARKGFTAFAVAPPGIMFILLIFFGYDKVWAVAIFVIALTFNGAVTAGYLGNGLDIAPNFSGTIFGMANTLSSLGGWVSTFMVGTLTHNVPVSY